MSKNCLLKDNVWIDLQLNHEETGKIQILKEESYSKR